MKLEIATLIFHRAEERENVRCTCSRRLSICSTPKKAEDVHEKGLDTHRHRRQTCISTFLCLVRLPDYARGNGLQSDTAPSSVFTHRGTINHV